MRHLIRLLIVAASLVSSGAFGAAAVRQEAIGALNNGAATTTATATFGSALLPGDAVVCWIGWGDVAASAPTTTADSAAQSYTLITGTRVYSGAGNNSSIEMVLLQNNTSSAAVTFTATFPTAVGFGSAWCDELSGVGTLVAGITQDQLNPGTGANAITSGAITATPTAPYFVVGLTTDINGNSPPPVAGTGFTSTNTGWLFSGNALARSENQSVATGSTPNAATFTDASFGLAGEFLTAGAIFPVSSAGPVAPTVGGGITTVPLHGLR